jgi:hypothetical protein
MTSDPELESWRVDWQSTDDIPSELRRRVEQQVRAERHTWWPPIVVTLVIGGGTLAWAITSGQPVAGQTAAATWLFIVVTWATSLAIRRYFGARARPEATTTLSFIDFAIRSCRVRRAGIVAAAVLCSLFLGFMLLWRVRADPSHEAGGSLTSARLVATAVVTALLAAAGWWQHRRLGRELESLLETKQQFENVTTGSGNPQVHAGG